MSRASQKSSDTSPLLSTATSTQSISPSNSSLTQSNLQENRLKEWAWGQVSSRHWNCYRTTIEEHHALVQKCRSYWYWHRQELRAHLPETFQIIPQCDYQTDELLWLANWDAKQDLWYHYLRFIIHVDARPVKGHRDRQKYLFDNPEHLNKEGKIYFLLTLYEEKTQFNRFMELIKPSLKYLTTVDFGKVTYKSEFESFLDAKGLNCTLKERCSGNFFLKYFKFYIYEAKMAAWLSAFLLFLNHLALITHGIMAIIMALTPK